MLPPEADWLDRLYARAPLPGWMLGVALALLVFAAVAVAAVLLEYPTGFAASDVLANRDLRFGISLTLLAAYMPTSRHYLLGAAARNRLALRSALGAGADAAFAARGPWLPGRHALLFVLAAPAVALAIDRDPGVYFRPDYWFLGNVWSWSVGAFSAWALGRHVIATLGISREFSDIAAALPEADPLDRRWLAPFASQALFSSLLWLLVPAIWAVNLVDAPFVFVVPVITAICIAVGSAALLLPTRGVRRRLAEAKERELALVHAALRGDDTALADSLLAGRLERPGVADLVAWARYVEELSTSPFTQASRLRFGLYLALPLGSWLGGALVEWLVERLLA